MSNKVTINLCVLWESELRQAAKLLQQCFDTEPGDPELANRMSHALTAAHAALLGLTDDKVVCMISGELVARK